MAKSSVSQLRDETEHFFKEQLTMGFLWGKYCVVEGEEVSEELQAEIDSTAKELTDAFWEDVSVHVLLDEMLQGKHKRHYSEMLENRDYLDIEPVMTMASNASKKLYKKYSKIAEKKAQEPGGNELYDSDEELDEDSGERDRFEVLDDYEDSVMSCLYPLIIYYVIRYGEKPQKATDFLYNPDAFLLRLFFGKNQDYKNRDVLSTMLAEVSRIVNRNSDDDNIKREIKGLEETILKYGYNGGDWSQFYAAMIDIIGIFIKASSKRAKSDPVQADTFRWMVETFQSFDKLNLSEYQGECVLYGMELMTGWFDYALYKRCDKFSRMDYLGIAMKVKMMEISEKLNEAPGTGENLYKYLARDVLDKTMPDEPDFHLEYLFWQELGARQEEIIPKLKQIRNKKLEKQFSVYTEAWKRLLSWNPETKSFQYECQKHIVLNSLIKPGAFGLRIDLCRYLLRYFRYMVDNNENIPNYDMEEDMYDGSISLLIKTARKYGATDEQVIADIMSEFQYKEDEASKKLKEYDKNQTEVMP